MTQFNMFLMGFLTALLAIVINILQNWIEGKPIQLTFKKIIITAIILLIFEIPLSYIQYSVPNMPSGFDHESTNIKSFWNNEGVTLYEQGNYSGAIWYYDRAIQMDSGYALAWGNKGKALKALHRDADAEKAFAKSRGGL